MPGKVLTSKIVKLSGDLTHSTRTATFCNDGIVAQITLTKNLKELSKQLVMVIDIKKESTDN